MSGLGVWIHQPQSRQGNTIYHPVRKINYKQISGQWFKRKNWDPSACTETESYELMPHSMFVPSILLPPDTQHHCLRDRVRIVWKGKTFGEMVGFFGESRVPTSLLLLYAPTSWTLVFKTVQPSDVPLTRFAALTRHLDFYIAIPVSNNKVLLSIFYAHIMCTSDNPVCLYFLIIFLVPLCLTDIGYLLTALKLKLFRIFIFKRFRPACAKCNCTAGGKKGFMKSYIFLLRTEDVCRRNQASRALDALKLSPYYSGVPHQRNSFKMLTFIFTNTKYARIDSQ